MHGYDLGMDQMASQLLRLADESQTRAIDHEEVSFLDMLSDLELPSEPAHKRAHNESESSFEETLQDTVPAPDLEEQSLQPASSQSLQPASMDGPQPPSPQGWPVVWT